MPCVINTKVYVSEESDRQKRTNKCMITKMKVEVKP